MQIRLERKSYLSTFTKSSSRLFLYALCLDTSNYIMYHYAFPRWRWISWSVLATRSSSASAVCRPAQRPTARKLSGLHWPSLPSHELHQPEDSSSSSARWLHTPVFTATITTTRTHRWTAASSAHIHWDRWRQLRRSCAPFKNCDGDRLFPSWTIDHEVPSIALWTSSWVTVQRIDSAWSARRATPTTVGYDY